MSVFGKTLFSGGRFIFWALVPFIVIFLIVTPLLVDKWTSNITAMLVGFWIVGVSLILGLYNPVRFRWALRVVSALIFLLYVAYSFSALQESHWKLKKPHSRGEANPVNALTGLVVVGGPALIYALLGRFTLRKDDEGENGALS